MGIFGKSPDVKPSDPPPARPAASLGAPPSGMPAAAPRAGSGAPCVIGAKTVVKGEISGEEDILIDGSVEGHVRVGRDLRVGPGGNVKATLEAQSITVSGEVTGDCIAQSRVEIQASGRVTGNIRAPKIIIAEGAMFKGTSDMSPRRDERKDRAVS
jgi:cytoskeletal protein CcmA (bactofilin family)